jgi:predicted ATPase
MQIGLKDFRCFHEPNPVRVRPINLLVGENSAGKTSFLAAMRFVLETFRRNAQASFNKDPFYLGSFEQVAHYRGGRFGRAKSFSFTIKNTLPKLRTPRRKDIPTNIEYPTDFTIDISFKENKNQPVIELIKFSAGEFGFTVIIEDSVKIDITTPSMAEYRHIDSLRPDISSPNGFIVSYVDFVLRDLQFLARRDPGSKKYSAESSSIEKNQKFLDEVEILYEAFRAAQMTLSHDVYASAPVRSKPERTYDPADFSLTADGGHTPFVMAQLRSFEAPVWNEIAKSLEAFGDASGLFESVEIKQIGKSGGSPFQLIINMPGRKSNIIDVGYGVSQVLPIVADTLRMEKMTFLFQQPEVHLHPRAQAALGSFLVNVCKKKSHTMLIETHSDHLIDRIRMEVRRGEFIGPKDVAIWYFSRSGHDVQISTIEIDKNGNLIDAPEEYRQFFLEEEARSIGLVSF